MSRPLFLLGLLGRGALVGLVRLLAPLPFSLTRSLSVCSAPFVRCGPVPLTVLGLALVRLDEVQPADIAGPAQCAGSSATCPARLSPPEWSRLVSESMCEVTAVIAAAFAEFISSPRTVSQSLATSGELVSVAVPRPSR